MNLRGGSKGQPNCIPGLLFLMAPKSLPQPPKPEKGELAASWTWHAGWPAWTQEAPDHQPLLPGHCRRRMGGRGGGALPPVPGLGLLQPSGVKARVDTGGDLGAVGCWEGPRVGGTRGPEVAAEPRPGPKGGHRPWRGPLEADFPLLQRTRSVFRLETGYNKLVNMSESCVGTT